MTVKLDSECRSVASQEMSQQEIQRLEEALSSVQEISVPHPSLQAKILAAAERHPRRKLMTPVREYAVLGCLAILSVVVLFRNPVSRQHVVQPVEVDYSMIFDLQADYEILDEDFIYLEELL